ncbi:hypothetical protein VPHK449_0038 [Vibrio phage K449]
MRITENVLNEACSEINTKFENLGSPHTIHVRQGQYGSGRIVYIHDGERTNTVTNIDESNRAVFAYLQGMDDAIHNYGNKPVKLQYKSSCNAFNELFTRCINDEFDLSVTLETVNDLACEIDQARTDNELNAYEYGRLIEQYKHAISTATMQVRENVRPAGNIEGLLK